MSHRKFRRGGAAAVAGVLACVLAACSSDTGSSGDSSSDAPAGDPVAGGELVVGIPPDAGCLDPHQVLPRVVLGITRQMSDSLINQNTETGEFEPWLASAWEVSPDGTTFTFTLRDDVTFSDGTPLNAEVVKANFDEFVELGPNAPLVSGYIAGLESTTVVDEHTFEVAFGAPNAQFLQGLSTPSMAILGASTIEATPAERCQGNLIGTGPFTIDSAALGQSVRMSGRDGYAWAPESFENSGDAYLDAVEFRMIPDASVRVGSMISGQANVVTEVLNQHITEMEGAGMSVVLRPNPGFANSLFVNYERQPLDDPAIREALQIGFDREELVLTTLTDRDLPATNVFATTTPGYTDLAELLAFNADEARSILDEAGWVPGADGIRERDGQRAEAQVMYFTPNYDAYVPMLELMRQYYGEIGFDLVLEPVPYAIGTERQIAWDFDLLMSGQTRADPAILGARDLGADEEFTALVDAQAAELDPDARMDIVGEATEMMLDRGYVLPIHELLLSTGYSPEVQGMQLDSTNALLLSNVWLREG